MISNKTLLFLLTTSLLASSLPAQTIAEKKESFAHAEEGEFDSKTQEQLAAINDMLCEKRAYLAELHEKSLILYRQNASEESFKQLLNEINSVKQEIHDTEEMWRDETASVLNNESYALLQQPNANLLQLVMDYGAREYVYIISPEIGALPLSINSNLPIPRESWSECLDIILSAQGVGIRQLSPYLRELYLLRNDMVSLKSVTSDARELELLPPTSRVCFILSPDVPDPRSVLSFMQKFSNPNVTTLQIISGDLFIISSVQTVKELLKLYEFVKEGTGGQDYQLVSLAKLSSAEMESILASSFHFGSKEDGTTLNVMSLASLPQSLLLFGAKDDVSKAIKLIREVEAQIEDPTEKTVFWYTVKHSDAEELAEVLSKVYDLLIGTPLKPQGKPISEVAKAAEEVKNAMVVKAPTIDATSAARKDHKTKDGLHNFIVDAKTGSIIMVVSQESLPKIKELLKKLDVPKKMVQLEVLLFEKKVSNQNNFGLNLLRLGKAGKPTNTDSEGMTWNTVGQGITQFLISHAKGSGIPAFDIAYNFLLGQDDVQINASPSVTTTNQTPAMIAIVEEISINTGTDPDKKDKSHLNAYTRAQYGITIQITPTINTGDDELLEIDGGGDGQYITLETEITFDTKNKTSTERPEVTRRKIKNHVRIPDGQTVIIGGLRSKTSEDSKESIPFLGEIPGIGKLFSITDMSDKTTEMFIFITPKIISDPLAEAHRMKHEELKKRPGDVPEFLHELMHAKSREKHRLFHGSLTALFGRPEIARKRQSAGEYEGR